MLGSGDRGRQGWIGGCAGNEISLTVSVLLHALRQCVVLGDRHYNDKRQILESHESRCDRS